MAAAAPYFAHLHVHTEHSALDGLINARKAPEVMASLGMDAGAITDHGSLTGTLRFHEAALKAGIKPIIGMEAYLAIGSRLEKNTEVVENDDENSSDADDANGAGKQKTKKYQHLTILARNESGWKNLLALHNKAEDSFWMKPRIDFDLLTEHGDGLIALTGCLAGPVAGPLARAGKADSDARKLAKTDGDAERIAELKEARDDYRAQAKEGLDKLIVAVGRDHVFLEVMFHEIAAEKHAFREIRRLSKETGIPMVATNDCHYTHEGDDVAHDHFLAVGTGATLDSEQRFQFNGTPDYYIKSPEQMHSLMERYTANAEAITDWKQACSNTRLVVDQVADRTIPEGKMRLPKFPVPDGHTEASLFHKMVLDGAKQLWGDDHGKLSPEVKDRLRTEEDIIVSMGFPSYFLIVQDVINWAKSDYTPADWITLQSGGTVPEDRARKKPILVGPGRGSAAGSACSYALGIVGVDPLRYGLLFERFLEPGRAGMPDIDVDFEQARRPEVLSYLQVRWGRANVAHLGTIGSGKTKAVLKDAARILKPTQPGDEVKAQVAELREAGRNPEASKVMREAMFDVVRQAGDFQATGNRLAALVPNEGNGAFMSLAKLMATHDDRTETFHALVDSSWVAARIVEVAAPMEGLSKSEGIHACGFIISPDPLDELVPMRHASHKEGSDPDAPRVITWEGGECEDYGLLKMDVLGLMNLDIAHQAMDIIGSSTGHQVTLGSIPDPEDTSDPVVGKAFNMLSSGETDGVFQMECVTGETLIGGRTIESAYRKQEDGTPYRRSLSYRLDTGKPIYNDVVRIVQSGEKPVKRLVSDAGRMIEATEGHRFMTENRGWVELRDLKVGDKVLADTIAKHRIHRTCIGCGKFTDSDPSNTSTRCYRCSASFHSNPTRHPKAISEGILKSYEGRDPWNKGLAAASNPIVAATGKKIAAALLGKTWDDTFGTERAAEKRLAMSAKMTGKGNPMFGRPTAHAKGGYREDLGHYVRSSWEADFARVLKYMGKDYEYEKQTFELSLDDGRTVTYTPDFWVPGENTFIEVKGYMRPLDQMKIDKFQELHPEFGFMLVDTVLFAEYQMKFQSLVAWECPVIPERGRWESVTEILDAGTAMTYDVAMAAPAHNYFANGFMVHNSGGMKQVSQEVGPDGLEDLSAVVALYRPGPMSAGMPDDYAKRKNGLAPVTYSAFTDDPEEERWIASVFGQTYGLAIYQETIMRLGTVVAGFDAAQKSRLRKAMGKKKQSEMDAVHEMWNDGLGREFRDENGEVYSPVFSEETGARLWDFIAGAASYLFNKSHSVAYGYLAYVTAYLKAGWPAEYGAAILSVVGKGKDEKRLATLQSLRTQGIEVLPPNVNTGQAGTTVVGEHIVLGMSEIKGVGSIARYVVAEREANGPFTDVADLARRVIDDESKHITTSALAALAESGALDGLPGSRLGQSMASKGAVLGAAAPDGWSWTPLEESRRQRQRIGVALGTHPVDLVGPMLPDLVGAPDPEAVANTPAPTRWSRDSDARAASSWCHMEDIAGGNGSYAATIGVVQSWVEKPYSKGRRVNYTLEGRKTSISGVGWNDLVKSLTSAGVTVQVGDVVKVNGRLQVREVELETEAEDGSTGSETLTVRELVADRIEVLDTGDDVVRPDGSTTDTSAGDFRAAWEASRNVVAARAAAKTSSKAKPRASKSAPKSAPAATEDVDEVDPDDFTEDLGEFTLPAPKPVTAPVDDELEEFDDLGDDYQEPAAPSDDQHKAAPATVKTAVRLPRDPVVIEIGPAKSNPRLGNVLEGEKDTVELANLGLLPTHKGGSFRKGRYTVMATFKDGTAPADPRVTDGEWSTPDRNGWQVFAPHEPAAAHR